MNEWISNLLGLGTDTQELSALQVSARAAVVFIATIITVRIGQKRFFGRNTALDFILAVILGSVEGRAINGGAPFVPTLVAGLVLVGIHWLFSWCAFHARWFGWLTKGRSTVVIKNGEPQERALRRLLFTRNDLYEDLRASGKVTGPEAVREARLERNGQLSVIKKETEPRVVEVQVRDGVQTVRIEVM